MPELITCAGCGRRIVPAAVSRVGEPPLPFCPACAPEARRAAETCARLDKEARRIDKAEQRRMAVAEANSRAEAARRTAEESKRRSELAKTQEQTAPQKSAEPKASLRFAEILGRISIWFKGTRGKAKAEDLARAEVKSAPDPTLEQLKKTHEIIVDIRRGAIVIVFLGLIGGCVFCAFRDPDFRRGFDRPSSPESFAEPSVVVNGKRIIIPPVRPENLGFKERRIGECGELSLQVAQVVGPEDMLVSDRQSDLYFWLHGVPTNGVFDGAKLGSHLYMIIGTTRYQTVNGGSKQVLVLIPSSCIPGAPQQVDAKKK